MRLVRYGRVESTNTAAYTLAERNAPEWTTVIAETQTRGRGRMGRRWKSPKGGLWLSVILRPHIPSERATILQFLVANSACKAIEKTTGATVGVKWPNDLLFDSKKVGGILLEMKTIRDKVSFLVVGVGVNVNQPASLLPRGATSLLLAVGHETPLLRLARVMVNTLRRDYHLLENPSLLMGMWWDTCVHREKLVRVRNGKSTIQGVNVGIDIEGELVIETEGGHRETIGDGTLRILDSRT